LDVASYWTQGLSYGSVVTLTLRMLLLVFTVALAFGLSQHRRTYGVAGAVCLVLYGCHLFACLQAGSLTGVWVLFEDATNYIRVAQIPLFTLAFVTFLRRCPQGWTRIQQGLTIAFFFIALVELFSFLTGTNPYTYTNKSLGLIGWFATGSAQSAILSMLFPLVLCSAMKEGMGWKLVLVTVVGFGELYLFATRLAYLAIFLIALGTVVTWAICRKLKIRCAALVLVCALLCGIGYQISPMKQNLDRVGENALKKEAEINELLEQGKEEFGTQGNDYLTYAYQAYLGGLVDKFGLDAVADIYQNTEDAATIVSGRTMKLNYCRLVLADRPLSSRLFGLCFGEMSFDGESYDVENDFHGILYLYGYGGLIALCAFFGYFLVLIAWALWKDPKRYFTVEAGACGIALITGLIHAYCTAGVLRRPNASFYLSLVLAMIWYLVLGTEGENRKETETNVHNHN
jgi:hypothetical protein